jgi:hypothetical protein
MTRTHRRAVGLAVLAAAAVIGPAACGGSSSSPQVASLGKSSGGGGGSGAAVSGNPTQLLDEWAACMRRHGDPNQADPVIDANKDIEITMSDVPKPLENAVNTNTAPCSNYMLAAQSALRGGQAAPTDNPVQDVKFAECMRASGFPTFPDPAGGNTDFNGTGINTNSTAFQNAAKTCDDKVGQPYYAPGTVPAGVIQTRDCSTPSGEECPGVLGASGGSGGNG